MKTFSVLVIAVSLLVIAVCSVVKEDNVLKAIGYVREHGLKTVIEEVWEGRK